MPDDEPPGQSAGDETYFDIVDVEVRPVEYLGKDSDESWFIQVSANQFDREWLKEQIQWLGYTEIRDSGGHVIRRENPVFALDVTEATTCWGFDGVRLSILLQIPLSAAGALLAATIISTARRIAGRISQNAANRQLPLNDTEAIERARWMIERRFGVEHARLELVAVETTDRTGAVTLQDSAVTRYLVQIEIHDGLVTVVQVRREFGAGS